MFRLVWSHQYYCYTSRFFSLLLCLDTSQGKQYTSHSLSVEGNVEFSVFPDDIMLPSVCSLIPTLGEKDYWWSMWRMSITSMADRGFSVPVVHAVDRATHPDQRVTSACDIGTTLT